MSASLTFYVSRHYPRWGARLEKYADGGRSWILNLWWVSLSLELGGRS